MESKITVLSWQQLSNGNRFLICMLRATKKFKQSVLKLVSSFSSAGVWDTDLYIVHPNANLSTVCVIFLLFIHCTRNFTLYHTLNRTQLHG